MRILSGAQPTGQLHIGNYLGAIKQWIEFQEKGNECLYFIADLHSLTVPFKPTELKKNIKNLAIDFIALGLDPKKSIIFIQSRVPYHTELAWFFNTLTPMGDLERMTQFKEKSDEHKKFINAGLFTYPILQAADILIYQTDVVPVGEDQIQHIELTRSIAKRFNTKFGETFKLPKPHIIKEGTRIMALDNPRKKMSKSGSDKNFIGLFEPLDSIAKKIKEAVTDSGAEIKYDLKNKPAISNLLAIFNLFSEIPIKQLEEKYINKSYAEFKTDLAETIIEYLRPLQEKRKELEKNPEYIENSLNEGTNQAKIIAEKTFMIVKEKIGII